MSTLIYADTETEAWNRQGRHSTEYADEQTQQEGALHAATDKKSFHIYSNPPST